MASLPIITGIVGGIFISETYRYLQSWFTSEDKPSSITINIGTNKSENQNDYTHNRKNPIFDHPVMIPTINEQNLFSQLQNFDQRKLNSIGQIKRKQNAQLTLMEDLKQKLNDRRINLAICNE